MSQRIVDPPLADFSDNSDPDSAIVASVNATVDDVNAYPTRALGYPLERMIRHALLNGFRFNRTLSSGSSNSDSSMSESSSVVYDINYEELIDEFLAKDPSIATVDHLIVVEPSTPSANNSVMVRRFPRSSSELVLLLELNHHELRHDPWNPSPYILCAVERDDNVYLFMRRLLEFHKPPFKTVANYIDFVRQCLEGLTFLHEHRIAQLPFLLPDTFMVDVSSGLSPSSSIEDFDRSRFPVRYYYMNYSTAGRFDSPEPFSRDVEQCGFMIDRLTIHVPHITLKMKALVKAMTSGNFSADNARKLFEALCKTLASSVFESPVPPLPASEALLFGTPQLLRPPKYSLALARSFSNPDSQATIPGLINDEEPHFSESTATLVPTVLLVRRTRSRADSPSL